MVSKSIVHKIRMSIWTLYLIQTLRIFKTLIDSYRNTSYRLFKASRITGFTVITKIYCISAVTMVSRPVCWYCRDFTEFLYNTSFEILRELLFVTGAVV